MAKASKTTGQNGADENIGQRLRSEATKSNNIRNWRLFKGVKTHGDLARITAVVDPKRKGIPRPTITRLETGELQWNEWHLTLISRALGVSRGDLIETNPFDAGSIFAVYAGLSDADRRKALKLLKSIKG